MNIGYLIRKVRLKKGISQIELAAKLEVSQQYISSIERDMEKISLQKFLTLSKALEICPKVFLICDKCKDLCPSCNIDCDKCIYKHCPPNQR